MAEDKDYLGEKLRLAERAREDAYFRTLDQVLIEQMRQKALAETEDAAQEQQLFTSILVPVDFSAYSAVALRYAAGIADRYAASVIVLHVIARETITYTGQQHCGPQGMTMPDPVLATYAPALPSDVMEEDISTLREQAYAALQACVPAQLAQHPVELRVVVGHPFERILETAVREHVGLIVLGTHGRTGLLHALIGSVAERVVRLAPCPVLTVKAATAEETDWLQHVYEKFIPQSSG